MENIGEKLRKIRNEKGISSNQLEILSGVNQSTIIRIETNVQSPSIETLLKICDALDYSIVHLFEDSADMINLINTAKKLSPNQRQKITEMIEAFLVKK
ncbi:helix-turn-helix domain-containing protein [Bacillus sp. PS06]|uniref:helix-turn-helix domain-containing protein n=1 Tax=Bacillus sp. PS06 TaxID=2764176 RepID=UPI0017862D2C|nr:helix-turn-helix transcriptional regulator [Bacillus sp. PS06]MBD8069297.1 helix-turn-helix transcriptional regulator [Bacillus sp. PS06]